METRYGILRGKKLINSGFTYEAMVRTIELKRSRNIKTKGLKVVKDKIDTSNGVGVLLEREIILHLKH